MLDDATTPEASVQPRCMWCSSILPSDSEVNCPTCGATLIGEGDNQVPGVTAIDAAAIIRGTRETKPQRRSRLMSWISGEYPEEDKPAPPGSLSPPPAEVRREMLRLELEAQVANLQAEAGAMAAEQAVEAVEAGATPEEAVADAAATVAAVDEVTAGAADLAAPPPEAFVAEAAEAAAPVADAVESAAPERPSDQPAIGDPGEEQAPA
ncbi:MAG TPA: hypothetical protein VFO05_01460 [Candidatus Limnocylindrales bacterium]|nr:hypothetical protein [Candidatus Limnocylindrales bacterium]